MTEIIETGVDVDAKNFSQKASQLLATHTGLSQTKIKEAMQKGAVWLLRGKGKKRLRRASKALQIGDRLELNYNKQIIEQKVPEPHLIQDLGDYSIWFKPYGLYCQGSRWGDCASIARWVEVNISKLTNGTQRSVFLVHRLDRATSGLILLCHSKTAARLFSEYFAAGKMDKYYQAIVHGDFCNYPQAYRVNEPVNGKVAISEFSCVESKDGKSLLDVRLLTGRKHQIRQHLSGLGFAIIGDRLYGNEQNPATDLQLQSVRLEFICPITQKQKNFTVKDSLRLKLDQ